LNPPTFTPTSLPSGLRVNQAAAAIVGTPTKPGKYSSTITAITYYGLHGRPSSSTAFKYRLDGDARISPGRVAVRRQHRQPAVGVRTQATKNLTFTGSFYLCPLVTISSGCCLGCGASANGVGGCSA
jgi:hypothetical protein